MSTDNTINRVDVGYFFYPMSTSLACKEGDLPGFAHDAWFAKEETYLFAKKVTYLVCKGTYLPGFAHYAWFWEEMYLV